MQPHVLEVIVVNDCSKDETGRIADEIARMETRVKVAHHPANRGKTEAVKTGVALTTGAIVIVQDADLEYDPDEIPEVIAPILIQVLQRVCWLAGAVLVSTSQLETWVILAT